MIPKQDPKKLKKWLRSRGIRTFIKDDTRLVLLHDRDYTKRKIKIKIINPQEHGEGLEIKNKFMYGWGCGKSVAVENLKVICPHAVTYKRPEWYELHLGGDQPLAERKLPSKTKGFWYVLGDFIGFENEVDKTWFMMMNKIN